MVLEIIVGLVIGFIFIPIGVELLCIIDDKLSEYNSNSYVKNRKRRG